MPQFDQFSFFNQVSWFLFFFFFFYFYFYYFYLSKIGYHLKFRKKIRGLVTSNRKPFHTEKNVIGYFLNSFYHYYCFNLELCTQTTTKLHVFQLMDPIVKKEIHLKLNQKFLLSKNEQSI